MSDTNKIVLIKVTLDEPMDESSLEEFGHKMFNYFSPDASMVSVTLVPYMPLPPGVYRHTYTVERVE